MSKEISRRTFLKIAGAAVVGITLEALGQKMGRSEETHRIFLPFVSRKEPERVDDLLTLLDEHRDYDMRVNSHFNRREVQSLLNQYGKDRLIFHWVDDEKDIPWFGYPQWGCSEWDGQTGMMMRRFTAYYQGITPHQTVEFWDFENPEYLDYISQKRGEPKESILSRVLSFQAWRGITSYSPEWLWGAIPSPNPTPEEIERYFSDNPLIVVSQ